MIHEERGGFQNFVEYIPCQIFSWPPFLEGAGGLFGVVLADFLSCKFE